MHIHIYYILYITYTIYANIYIYIYKFHFQLELEGWVRIISAQFPHNAFRQVCGTPPTFQIMIRRGPPFLFKEPVDKSSSFVPGPYFVLAGLLVLFCTHNIRTKKKQARIIGKRHRASLPGSRRYAYLFSFWCSIWREPRRRPLSCCS